MRKLLRLAPLLGLGLLLMAPTTLMPGGAVTFANCSSGGSAAQSLVTGNYLMTVFDEEVFVCFAASASTCASGGVRFSPGSMIKFAINAGMQSVSCRSAGSTGDLEFTPAS